MSLVFDESDKYTTIYDSYNAELAAKYIKSVKLTSFTEIYSLKNENKKYDMDNGTQKHLLYKQFVAWTCNGRSTAPLTGYINNPVYQELIDDEYDSFWSDERFYLDLRVNSGYTEEAEKLERNDLKINLWILFETAATKKLRLRIWTYSLGEYLYLLSRQVLTLRHKTYSISQEDDDFLESVESSR